MNLPANGGKAALGVVEALKQSPLLLVLLLFNAGFIVAVYYNSKSQREQQTEIAKHLLENQNRMQDLIIRCFPAQPKP
jgi:hypothetical protein